MKLYHRTGAASAILANGFQDATGSYMLVGITLSGVWLADQPLDANEGAKGRDLLEVTFPGDVDLSFWELVPEVDGEPAPGYGGYREWCMPAALINDRAAVRLMTFAEEEELESQAGHQVRL